MTETSTFRTNIWLWKNQTNGLYYWQKDTEPVELKLGYLIKFSVPRKCLKHFQDNYEQGITEDAYDKMLTDLNKWSK